MKEDPKIRLMIVDDHTVIRSGLRLFLLAFNDIELVAEAESGTQALELCQKLEPDVVLMDLVMPGMDGVAATAAIRQNHPNTQVIALTSFPEEKMVEEVLAAGAISYLLKNVSATDLARTIREAYVGHSVLAPEASRSLANHDRQEDDDATNTALTKREQEILNLMTKGFSNVEIGEQLFISRSTAKFHVSNILAKLNATTRAEAVAIAIRQRLVIPEK
ncbi:MAG TPA: response regulator transcription factor [Anaerolineae bacterium]|nr:response regulator transcription factor [Anaerolineae bacterium]HMR63336.1 response regulator transcription factor [Anaerolineae bacterium]